jgi:hypothetical protein
VVTDSLVSKKGTNEKDLPAAVGSEETHEMNGRSLHKNTRGGNGREK